MSKVLSVNLSVQVLAAVSGGAPHRETAERFGVSAASVSRWRNRTPRFTRFSFVFGTL
jgi:transposase